MHWKYVRKILFFYLPDRHHMKHRHVYLVAKESALDEIDRAFGDLRDEVSAAQREKEAAIRRMENELEDSIRRRVAGVREDYHKRENEQFRRYDRAQREKDAQIAQLKEANGQLEAQLEKAMAELQEYKDEVRNGNRIAIERANADRGIPDKEEHPGYLVLSVAQYREHINNSNYDAPQEVITWKTVLQSPYMYSEEHHPLTVQKKILLDLREEMLDFLNIHEMMEPEENGIYRTFGDENDLNGLYRWLFRCDGISGYWGIELYTTHVPTFLDMFLPPKKENPKTGSGSKGRKQAKAEP